jgi:signal transduction histidine kinase
VPRLPSRGWLLVDSAIAAGLVAITAVAPDSTRWSGVAAVTVASVGVALRRVSPLVGCALACAALVGSQLLPGKPEDLGTFVAVLVTVFTAAAYGSRAVVGAAAGVAAVAVIAETLLAGSTEFAFVMTFLAVALAAGLAARRPLIQSRHLAERAREAEQAAADQAREAVQRERSRLARELHDIVSHGVAVMVVQATAAEHVRDDHARADPLRAIQATGRETLAELQRLLGVLRAGDDEERIAPQPTLAQLDGLLEPLRATGLDVILDRYGDRRALPASVEASIFRVVQEALTNAVRHGDAHQVRIALEYGADRVTAYVDDDGTGTGGDRPSGGRGLAGMRERIALLGGDLQAGPRPDGGFAVRATVPLERGHP